MTSSFIQARPGHVGRSFYLMMSLILTGIVLLGFSHTVPSDLAAPGFPAVLWLHAGVFGAWVLLFMVQPTLALRGSLALHRWLGWLGLALGCCMVVLGAVAVLLALWAGQTPPFYPHAFFLVRGFVGLALFAGLLAAGIALRRKADWHKRLMLCASIPVIIPALERAMPIPLMGAAWPLAVDAAADLLVSAGPVTDFIVGRRVHPAYLAGVGAIIGSQLLVYLLSYSALAPLLLASVHAR